MLLQLYNQKGHPRLGSSMSRQGGQIARDYPVPAPSGGMNARDSRDAMEPADAVTLENFILSPGKAKTRPGYDDWAYIGSMGGLASICFESLMEYAPPSGTNKLFGAVQERIYNVTSSGATGSADVSSLTNGRWQHVHFSTPAGNYLYCVNGADNPRHYNGSAWASPTITGTNPASASLTKANLIHVSVHMNRLFFVEKSTLYAWYLDVQAISGTATCFDLSSLFRRGGELLCTASWTRDGGGGADDYGVFITSKGEVAVYAGTDPGASTTWALVGIYKIPEPLGRRCALNIGSELIILTSEGPIPLSQIMGTSNAAVSNFSLTNKIVDAFKAAYAEAGTLFGWQIIENAKLGIVLVNAPITERATQRQFCFSTSTGGWTAWTAINAGCWSAFGDTLYFGGNDGYVYKLGASDSDNGTPIVQTYIHSFHNMKSPYKKRVTMARPRLVAPPGFTPNVQIRADYDVSVPTSSVALSVASGSEWDSEYWDDPYWGDESVATKNWQVVTGLGTVLSVAMRWAAMSPVTIEGVDLSFEAGGVL